MAAGDGGSAARATVDRMFGQRIKPQPQTSQQSVQNGEQSVSQSGQTVTVSESISGKDNIFGKQSQVGEARLESQIHIS